MSADRTSSSFTEDNNVLSGQSSLHYKTMAATSTPPRAAQQIALRCSPANQYPVAALKQRIALVHPLAHAAGLLSIFRISIRLSYRRKIQPELLTAL